MNRSRIKLYIKFGTSAETIRTVPKNVSALLRSPGLITFWLMDQIHPVLPQVLLDNSRWREPTEPTASQVVEGIIGRLRADWLALAWI